MSTPTIVVAVLRPLLWLGTPVPAGHTLKVDALQAQHLVDSGRARLVHDADRSLCQEAVRADVRAALKAEGRPRHGPEASAPWQR